MYYKENWEVLTPVAFVENKTCHILHIKNALYYFRKEKQPCELFFI